MFRNLPGSFDAATRGLTALRDVGVPVQINTTVAKHNQEQLEAILQLTKSLGAVALHFFLLVPVGCGVEIAEEQMISAEDYERVLNWLYDKEQQEPNLQLKATCAPHYFRVTRQRRAQENRQGTRSEMPPSHQRQVQGGSHMHAATKGCLAGTGVCFISHQGEVFPCGYLPVEAGNIRRQRFAEIWEQSELFTELRNPDLLTGKCGLCHFKSLCSGCRARAYGMVGDYLAEEPFCVYNPV
jgi:radical SAM protein with 4Fe4S-binding SPASM domain